MHKWVDEQMLHRQLVGACCHGVSQKVEPAGLPATFKKIFKKK